MEGGAIIRDLGDGLLLRRATRADEERLVALRGEEESAYVRRLMRGDHPTIRPEDFTLVEYTRTGAVVSTACFTPQTWSYDGIPFGVGKTEYVETHPDYRRRGLVRAQFEVMHAWSAERGFPVCIVGGIAWFYRQFGYEMGLEIGGGRSGLCRGVPELAEGEPEPYRLRPATPDDVPFLTTVYAQGMQRYRVAAVRDEALWRYELGRGDKGEYRVIETSSGEAVGLLHYRQSLWQGLLSLSLYELAPGISWFAVTPSVVRALRSCAGEAGPPAGLGFWLGAEHPAYEVLPESLSRAHPPYSFHVRVPDVPAFLRHVAPALERRLAGSVAAGYTGELHLNFYRSGLRLAFERGRLAAAEPWHPERPGDGDAAFPELTFLQLLFGYRSLAELRHAFADCQVRSESAQVLLNLLFPRHASSIWYVS